MKRRVFATLMLSSLLALSVAAPAFAVEQQELGQYAAEGYEVAVAPRSNSDTGWSFDMSFKGTDGVYPRLKENNTSVYVYVQYKNMDRYNLYVDGMNNTSGSGRLACTVNGEAYVFRVGEFQMYNHVYENGKKYAQLTGYASYEGGNTGGLWSPDSVGSYPIINKGYIKL